MRILPLFAALPLLANVACRTTADDTSPSDGGAGDSGHTTTTDDAGLTGTGTLFLIASGGGAGDVSADVALYEPGVGQEQACTNPSDAGPTEAGTGACQLTACAVGGIGSPYPGYGNYGPVSVTVGTTTESLTYDQSGYPTIAFPSTVSLGTGGTMEFKGGDGKVVPIFDVTATIPGLAAITAPVPATAGGSATIDTSQDLAVTWAPIPAGEFSFALAGGTDTPGGTSVTIACNFDGTAGSGTVPQALLSAMKQLAASTPVYASVGTGITTTTTVGALKIVTQSSQSSKTALRGFNVTFQ